MWKFLQGQVLDVVKGIIIEFFVKLLFVAAIIWGAFFAYDYYVDKKVEAVKQDVVDKASQAKATVTEVLKDSGIDSKEVIDISKEKATEAKEKALDMFKSFMDKNKEE